MEMATKCEIQVRKVQAVATLKGPGLAGNGWVTCGMDGWMDIASIGSFVE